MSFFDEGDEPPTRAQPRTRRAPSAGRGGGSGGGGPRPRGAGVDPAIRQRRLIALAFGVLLIIVFAIGVRACVNSAAESQLRDYNRDVGTVVAQSDRDVSRPLFDLLGQSGQSPVELETQINQLASVAARQLDEAKGFDTPDELTDAQHNLLLTLDLRETGVRQIARQVRTALADSEEAEVAQTQIAAQMQQFLASDVVYKQRVLPYITDALKDRNLGDDQQDSQFLPDLTWLEPSTVADALGGGGGGGADSGSADEGDVAPGLHGHGLVSVAIGDTTLQPGEVVNRVAAGSGLALNVTVANQGENPEEDVKVSVRISGSGKPITASRTIDSTQPGTNAEIAIPIESTPTIGSAVQVTVSVAKVPGEEKTDNNRQTYTVLFQS